MTLARTHHSTLNLNMFKTPCAGPGGSRLPMGSLRPSGATVRQRPRSSRPEPQSRMARHRPFASRKRRPGAPMLPLGLQRGVPHSSRGCQQGARRRAPAPAQRAHARRTVHLLRLLQGRTTRNTRHPVAKLHPHRQQGSARAVGHPAAAAEAEAAALCRGTINSSHSRR
jgi:hypothetical protein